MAAKGTYDVGLGTLRDRLRFALGDTAKPFDLADETIDAVIARAPTAAEAGARLAESLAALYAKRARDSQQGSVRKMFGDRASAFQEMATTWRATGLPGEDEADAAEVLPAKPTVGQLAEPDLTHYRRFVR
jgi:hypothetical protein